MRFCRLILVVLLATGLAVLPVSAGVAVAHLAKAEMSMSGLDDGCASCQSAKTETCSLACCQTQALAVEGIVIAKPRRERFGVLGAEDAASIAHRPDPPPPRS